MAKLSCVLGSVALLAMLMSCAGGSSYTTIEGAAEGSQPINAKEEIQYKQALLHCYKTGGTRIIKLNGSLMCY